MLQYYKALEEMVVTITQTQNFSASRLDKARFAFTTRRVDQSAIAGLISGNAKPRSGDLVLARVVKLGHHTGLQLCNGRRAKLFPGDTIVVACGNRYAPSQYEAVVPTRLGAAHLVAGGGIAARALNRNRKTRAPTRIHIEGILSDASGRAINLADWALPEPTLAAQGNPVIYAVAGTTMDAGKTTSAAHLIKGLASAGLRVGAAKVTGTGAGGDLWLMLDAGAEHVVDFTDAGYASTYKTSTDELVQIFNKLTGHLACLGMDAIVVEVADGLLQQETSSLLQTSAFRDSVHAMLFAAGDAMGAVHGVNWLRKQGLPVFATCGLITLAPLAAREARQSINLPSVSLKKLADPSWAAALHEQYSLSIARPVLGIASLGNTR
jgi:hypothetical protein